MKIISKFHDYYDSAMIMHDDHVVLKRTTEVVKNIDLPYYAIHVGGKTVRHEDGYNYTSSLIIDILYFCGKVYPIFTCKKYVDNYDRETRRRNTKLLGTICFDGINSFFDFFKSENYSTSYYSMFRKNKRRDADDIKKQYEVILEKMMQTNISDEYFRKIDAPYFIHTYLGNHNEVVRYPVLKDLTKSFKLDAFTAFQEIDMYVGGVIGSEEKEIIEVSDIDKRNSKGFDNYSFKTRKGQ